MNSARSFRQLRIAVGIAAAIALAAVVIAGLQRVSVAQAEARISLDAPVSFPVDI